MFFFLKVACPNITGLFAYACDVIATGAFNLDSNYFQRKWEYKGDGGMSAITFDASRSSPVYRAVNTVQPPALVFNYIIKY